MIKSFKSKETEKVFNKAYSKKLPENIQQRALRKLRMIQASVELNDLRTPPGNRLEALSGERAGQHSIRINPESFRECICFIWQDGDAYEVEIVDYH